MVNQSTRNAHVPPQAIATRPAADGAISSRQITAGLLMVTGIGWNAGLQAQPFHPLTVGVGALAFHVAPLAAVLIVLVRTLRSGRTTARRGRGVSIAAVLALAFGVFSAVFSITHPHAAMGVHDLNDLLPIAILNVGALLWLIPSRRAAVTAA
jgi:hypothetical protein